MMATRRYLGPIPPVILDSCRYIKLSLYVICQECEESAECGTDTEVFFARGFQWECLQEETIVW